eukprot:m.237026 g.237026  ORF g.237026 m.237026 type:complete len:359 (+) comp17416_c0_seq12:6919-7995(+)
MSPWLYFIVATVSAAGVLLLAIHIGPILLSHALGALPVLFSTGLTHLSSTLLLPNLIVDAWFFYCCIINSKPLWTKFYLQAFTLLGSEYFLDMFHQFEPSVLFISRVLHTTALTALLLEIIREDLTNWPLLLKNLRREVWWAPATCVVCMNSIERGTQYVTCPRGHATDTECLHHMLQSLIANADEDQIRCPTCRAPFKLSYLAPYLSSTGFDHMLQLERRRAERQVLADFRRQATETNATKAYQQLISILNLKCPSCEQVFIDFDGCFALVCSRCRINFCGWCLQQCSSNSAQHHSHISRCPMGNGQLYSNLTRFNEHHRRRQQDQVKLFLSLLPSSVRNGVTQRAQHQIQDLGIVV